MANNRQNPTPFNVRIPKGGIFTDTGGSGIVFLESNGQRISFDPVSLLTDEERTQLGNRGEQQRVANETSKSSSCRVSF